MGKSDLRKIRIIILALLLTAGNMTTAYADSTRKMVITATVPCNQADKKKEPDAKAGATAVSVNEPVTQTGRKEPAFSAGVKGTTNRGITEAEYITDMGPKECHKENKSVVNKDAGIQTDVIIRSPDKHNGSKHIIGKSKLETRVKAAVFILLIILVVAVISRLLMKGTAGHEKKGFA